MTITQQMQLMGQGEYWFFVGLLTLFAGGCFWFGFRSLWRARIIENTPTARVRSAPQGYVELTGKARAFDGQPTLAPLTGTRCCWYRYKIERISNKKWQRVESGSSDELFLFEDDTGLAIVDPEGAEVTPSERSVWYGHHRQPDDRKPPRKRLIRPDGQMRDLLSRVHVGGSLFARYRYTEEYLFDGDPLYSIGLFKTLGESDFARERDDRARGLLRSLKADQRELLARFDANGDGQIDLQEWEQARNAAQQQAAHEQRQERSSRILHSLSKPTQGRQPFLLSAIEQYGLVRRHRITAAACSAGFLLFGGIVVWMLGAR